MPDDYQGMKEHVTKMKENTIKINKILRFDPLEAIKTFKGRYIVWTVLRLTSRKYPYHVLIRTTFPCEYPLIPQIYIVKLGHAGVYLFSLFCSKTYIEGTR